MEEEYEQKKELSKQLFCAYLSLSKELTKTQLRSRLNRLPASVFEGILEELAAQGAIIEAGIPHIIVQKQVFTLEPRRYPWFAGQSTRLFLLESRPD